MTAAERERLTINGLVFGVLVATTMPLWNIRTFLALMAVLTAAIFVVALVVFVKVFDPPAWLRMRRDMKRRVREIRQRPPRTSDELLDLFEREVQR